MMKPITILFAAVAAIMMFSPDIDCQTSTPPRSRSPSPGTQATLAAGNAAQSSRTQGVRRTNTGGITPSSTTTNAGNTAGSSSQANPPPPPRRSSTTGSTPPSPTTEAVEAAGTSAQSSRTQGMRRTNTGGITPSSTTTNAGNAAGSSSQTPASPTTQAARALQNQDLMDLAGQSARRQRRPQAPETEAAPQYRAASPNTDNLNLLESSGSTAQRSRTPGLRQPQPPPYSGPPNES